MPKFTERLQSAWNAFLSREPTRSYEGYGVMAVLAIDRTEYD